MSLAITKIERFLDTICQSFWALSQTQMTDFPTLSYTSTSEIPTFHIPEA